MRKFKMSVYLVVLFIALNVYPCGNEFKAVQAGKKALGIELHDQVHNKDFFAIDDNGMLVAGLIAAYCRQGFDHYPRYEIPKESEDCVDKAQSDDLGTRVYSSYEGDASAGNLARIKSQCKIDLENEFVRVLQANFAQQLPCVAKAKDIVKRAAQRYSDYVVEIKSKKYKASKNVIDGIYANLDRKKKILKEMARVFSLPNPKVGDFNKWLSQFESEYGPKGTESFLITDSMEFRENSKEYQPLGHILSDVNASLPDLMMSMCGENLPDSLITQLSKSDWVPDLSGGNNDKAAD